MVAARLGLFDRVLQTVKIRDLASRKDQITGQGNLRAAKLDKVRNGPSCVAGCVKHLDGQSPPINWPPADSGFLHGHVPGQDLGGLLRIVMKSSAAELLPESLRYVEEGQLGSGRHDPRTFVRETERRPCHVAAVMGQKHLFDVLQLVVRVSVENDPVLVSFDGNPVHRTGGQPEATGKAGTLVAAGR